MIRFLTCFIIFDSELIFSERSFHMGILCMTWNVDASMWSICSEPYSFSYFRLLFFVSPHMLVVGNLCSCPCCLATFSNTFYGLNNCQLLALVLHLTMLQPASLILLALPAWFPDACCSPYRSLLLRRGRKGKGQGSDFCSHLIGWNFPVASVRTGKVAI